MEKHVLSKQEALDKAQVYCARSEHCASDVRRKLYEWGVDAETADFIEQNLYDNGYLDDIRYCRAYVHDKVAYQKWGRMKIRAGLQALRLPSSAIYTALDEMDEVQYAANLHALQAQRKSDTEEKRLRFLLQRGFTYDEIQGK